MCGTEIFPLLSVQEAPVAVRIHELPCGGLDTGCCDITVFVRAHSSDTALLRLFFGGKNEYGDRRPFAPSPFLSSLFFLAVVSELSLTSHVCFQDSC